MIRVWAQYSTCLYLSEAKGMMKYMQSLYNKLLNYSKSDYYPMHMPGHKRQSGKFDFAGVFDIDITEIDGFDDLNDPKGILLLSQQRAGRLFGSKETFYLVNGSTVGILSAISACAKRNGKVLMARNCHKSVYNGVYINQLEPVYIYPNILNEFGVCGGINPCDVENHLKNNEDIDLVIITSPTYDGVVSDISKIKEITKRYNAVLMVDEAHGAHFGFSDNFPMSALKLGADIVINSLHKTLPALTQTALLHVNYDVPVETINKIKMYLSIYQSSSPSYVLMSSIDKCIEILNTQSNNLFFELERKLQDFYCKTKELKYIKVFQKSDVDKNNIFDFDFSKLLINVGDTSINGVELYNILLNKYHIQMEMVSVNYVLGITSIFDTEEGFNKLLNGLKEVDSLISKRISNNIVFTTNYAKISLSPYMAYENKSIDVELINSVGKISAEYVYLYPPGIPLLVPGEVILGELIDQILIYKNLGLEVKGLLDKSLSKIKVIL